LKPGARLHWADDVAEIEALLIEHGGAHLVGHSYGALVALTVARRQPSRVRALSLFDPGAFGGLYDPPDHAGLDDLGAVLDDSFRDEVHGGDEAWLERFVDYWNGRGAWRALAAPVRQSFLRVGRAVFYAVTTLAEDRTPAPAYEVIRAPTLLLTGQRSPIAVRRVVARLAERLPRARVVEIEGAGHMGPLTHADQVNALIVKNVC
jgi:pimeloyl-ACP methyl ester carboxylesterase